MATPVVSPIQQENIIAENVSADEYMEQYAEHFNEWVHGKVISLSPIHEDHDALTRYASFLLEAYFALRSIGVLREAPFVMSQLKAGHKREPDLLVVLNENLNRLKKTSLEGPADICIEVVSPATAAADYGAKFLEYELEGVREYWRWDKDRQEAAFYRLENEKYVRITPDQDGNYRTPLLPGFVLHVPTLWGDTLPDYFEIGEYIKKMLEKASDE
jgi:Uma2 family endonuclease